MEGIKGEMLEGYTEEERKEGRRGRGKGKLSGVAGFVAPSSQLSAGS